MSAFASQPETQGCRPGARGVSGGRRGRRLNRALQARPAARTAALAAALAAAMVLPPESVRGDEAPRERTDAREPSALSILVEVCPLSVAVPGGDGVDLDLEAALAWRSAGIFRLSASVPIRIRAALGGDYAGRMDASLGDPSVEAGIAIRRGSKFASVGAGYSAPLGPREPDPLRPLRPASGSGYHRFTLSAGMGAVRDPAALSCYFSWTVSLPRPGDPRPSWIPADLGFSVAVVEALNDRLGISAALASRVSAPALGPGAGPNAQVGLSLEARFEVHLRVGRLFLRTGAAWNLSDPNAAARPRLGAELELARAVPGEGGT
ncbi:MAG TPA: hypothetical protein VLH39_02510 [Magnetospirillaceae bacterium]|nr:hypothetical protein [Magnetospirillaceae bacterium]